jgi:hypothetical protein
MQGVSEMSKLLDAPKFLTRPQVEPQEDISPDQRGTWLLLSMLVYFTMLGRRIFSVPAGFITDLASTPRLPFVYLIAGGLGHAAAILHDWLYTSHEVDRRTADDIFHEALLVCGVPAWKAWLMWSAVRVAGGSRWDAPGPDQPVVVQREIATVRATL